MFFLTLLFKIKNKIALMIYTNISTSDLERYFKKTKGELTECLKDVCSEFIIIDKKVGKSNHEFLLVLYESQDEVVVYNKLGLIKSKHKDISLDLELLDSNKYQLEVKDY